MKKKLGCLLLALTMSLSAATPCLATAESNEIPAVMEPNTIVTYDENLNMTITKDTNINRPIPASSDYECEIPDYEGRAAEDAMVAAIDEELKDYPTYYEDVVLPTPQPGMTVIYGSDGGINHIYYGGENSNDVSMRARQNLAEGTTAAIGTYTYGSHNNKIKITSTGVTGEGRFTVFRAGVGGSGEYGSSGKKLGTGDVATKITYDNPKSGTAMDARALDTDILKTVYKNDVGSLPDAVLDVYYWGTEYPYFGYMYTDTLSFTGRYHYNF
jgi:hypothetical protein